MNWADSGFSTSLLHSCKMLNKIIKFKQPKGNFDLHWILQYSLGGCDDLTWVFVNLDFCGNDNDIAIVIQPNTIYYIGIFGVADFLIDYDLSWNLSLNIVKIKFVNIYIPGMVGLHPDPDSKRSSKSGFLDSGSGFQTK